jgi:hypothetical protein
MLNNERLKERIVSALLTAIQRAKMAGDDPIYVNALIRVLEEFVGGQKPAEEKKPEETKSEE